MCTSTVTRQTAQTRYETATQAPCSPSLECRPECSWLSPPLAWHEHSVYAGNLDVAENETPGRCIAIWRSHGSTQRSIQPSRWEPTRGLGCAALGCRSVTLRSWCVSL